MMCEVAVISALCQEQFPVTTVSGVISVRCIRDVASNLQVYLAHKFAAMEVALESCH